MTLPEMGMWSTTIKSEHTLSEPLEVLKISICERAPMQKEVSSPCLIPIGITMRGPCAVIQLAWMKKDGHLQEQLVDAFRTRDLSPGLPTETCPMLFPWKSNGRMEIIPFPSLLLGLR